MFDTPLSPLRTVHRLLMGNDSSQQIAAGVTIGVVLGLVPKATLLAGAIGFLLCAVRVNKTAGLAAAGVAAGIAPLLDPFTHKIGLKVLTIPSLQEAYAVFYDAPLGPWWGLHNTVVCGSLLLGLYLTYPVYVVTRSAVDRVRGPVIRWAQRRRIGRTLLGADLATRVGAAVSG